VNNKLVSFIDKS